MSIFKDLKIGLFGGNNSKAKASDNNISYTFDPNEIQLDKELRNLNKSTAPTPTPSIPGPSNA